MPPIIAIIDDDSDDLELMEEAIRSFNPDARCLCFPDPVHALTSLCSPDVNAPECIFIDINMPKMLGPELLVVLRSHPKFDNVPIAMLSTSMPDHMSRQLLNSGANYAVQKPYKVEAFAKLIAAVLGTSGA